MTENNSQPTTNRAILIKNCRVIDPGSNRDDIADILITDGKIAAIGQNLSAPENNKSKAKTDIDIIDGTGFCISPGLIDLRTQAREPGFEHEENLSSLAEAASAGGVTQLCCLPNTQPIIEDPSMVAMIRQKRHAFSPKIHPFAALTKGLAGQELSEMGLLHEAGAIGFTDAPNALSSPLVLRRALSYARFFDGLVMTHPEEPSLAQGAMNEGAIATEMGLSGRPTLAEIIQVERDIRLAEATHGRLHIGPLTCAGSIEAVRQAKLRGVKITCDTAPHYYLLNETAVLGYRTFAKVAPPLRSENDRLAVLAGLADGTIDAVTSDHAPRAADSKRLPFAQAAFGVVGVETLLPAILWLYHQKIMTLKAAMALVTKNPERIIRQIPSDRDYGLHPGHAADMVIFNLDSEFQIDTDYFKSKSKNSAFDGAKMQGQVVRTIIGGETAYPRGE